MTLAQLLAQSTEFLLGYVGGMSDNDKMPGLSFSIPAEKCQTGSKLRKVKDSVCSICYALRFRYQWAPIQKSMRRRFARLGRKHWAPAIAEILRRKEKSGAFRWHDAGDIQSVEHLERIVAVAAATPAIAHWLPTKEVGFVRQYVRKHGVNWPTNLCVRISAPKIGQEFPLTVALALGCTTSAVKVAGYDCPAHAQDNQCRDCRRCWDKGEALTTYPVH